MSTAADYAHIEVDQGGIARLKGSRYKVNHLAAEHYHYGWTAEELLRQHPDLEPAEVYAALTYFYDHRAEILAEMQPAPAQRERAGGAEHFPSRAELLARRSA